jgi:hypothetical protein
MALKMIGWAANIKESDNFDSNKSSSHSIVRPSRVKSNLYLCETARTMITTVMTGSRVFQGTQA